jgi:hypothetical protein
MKHVHNLLLIMNFGGKTMTVTEHFENELSTVELSHHCDVSEGR